QQPRATRVVPPDDGAVGSPALFDSISLNIAEQPLPCPALDAQANALQVRCHCAKLAVRPERLLIRVGVRTRRPATTSLVSDYVGVRGGRRRRAAPLVRPSSADPVSPAGRPARPSSSPVRPRASAARSPPACPPPATGWCWSAAIPPAWTTSPPRRA